MAKSPDTVGKVEVKQISRDRRGGMTALVLQISYEEDTEAEATILLRPGQLAPPTADSIRREVLRLGLALQKAAQSPQLLPGSPQEQR